MEKAEEPNKAIYHRQIREFQPVYEAPDFWKLFRLEQSRNVIQGVTSMRIFGEGQRGEHEESSYRILSQLSLLILLYINL